MSVISRNVVTGGLSTVGGEAFPAAVAHTGNGLPQHITHDHSSQLVRKTY